MDRTTVIPIKRNFLKEYERLCVLLSVCPLPHVVSKLKENILEINADRIHGDEWEPIIGALHCNASLKMILIKSKWQHNAEKTKNYPQRKIPIIHSKELVTRLVRALKDCLCRSDVIQSLSLENLMLKEKELTVLAKGLARSTSLRYLSLKYSKINDRIFEGFIKKMKAAQSLLCIDVTGCGLTWKSANHIADLMKYQSMIRHSEAWQESLRYRRPDMNKIHGLQRITLNENKIGDIGVKILAEVLKDDLWLKALDLQQCLISNDGATVLLEMLNYNKSLDVLDLRGNKNIDIGLLRAIIEKVMMNAGGENPCHRWTVHKIESKEKQHTKNNKLRKRIPTKTTRKRPPIVLPSKKSAEAKPSKVNTTFTYETPEKQMFDNETSKAEQSSSLFTKHDSIVKEIQDLEEELQFYKEHFEQEQYRRMSAEQHIKHLLLENEKMTTEIKSLKLELRELQKNQSINEKTSNQKETQNGKTTLDDEKVLESIESTYKEFQEFLDVVNNLGFGDLYSQMQQQRDK